MRLLGKAFLDLLSGGKTPPSGSDTAQSSPAPNPLETQTGSPPTAAQAYTKAGTVVQRHGKPYLSKPSRDGAPGQGVAPIQNGELAAPADTSSTPPVQADEATAAAPSQGSDTTVSPGSKPMTPERAELLRQAMAIHRKKQGILSSLSREDRERLNQMALAAFKLKR